MKQSDYILFVLASFVACCIIFCNRPASAKDHSEEPNSATQTQAFKDYWYAGKAELNHYNMSQIRYEEITPWKRHHGVCN